MCRATGTRNTACAGMLTGSSMTGTDRGRAEASGRRRALTTRANRCPAHTGSSQAQRCVETVTCQGCATVRRQVTRARTHGPWVRKPSDQIEGIEGVCTMTDEFRLTPPSRREKQAWQAAHPVVSGPLRTRSETRAPQRFESVTECRHEPRCTSARMHEIALLLQRPEAG